MKIPFELELQIPDMATSEILEIFLYCNSDNIEDVEPSDEVVQIFASAVNERFFQECGSLFTARMKPVKSLFNAAEKAWYYEFEAYGIPATAFPVLIGMLVQMHIIGDLLEKVVIKPKDKTLIPVDVNKLISALEEQETPPASVPFEVEYDEPQLGKDGVIITIEFEQTIDGAFVESLDEKLNIWAHLVYLKGYNFDDQDVFYPRLGDATHIGPCTMRYVIDIFEAPNFAMNPFFNFCSALHFSGKKIDLLIVE